MRAITMRTITTAIALCILLSLLGCSFSNPCNESLLERFKTTKEAEYSFMFIRPLLQGGASKDNGWGISRRGDGCVVAYKATVNSRDYEWYHWYIDLENLTVYPDDKDAELVIQMGGVPPTVLSK